MNIENLFYDCLKENNWEYDGVFDWTLPSPTVPDRDADSSTDSNE